MLKFASGITAILCTLMLTAASLPTVASFLPAHAEDAATETDSPFEYYVVSSGKICITACPSDQKIIEIPEKIGYYFVTEIASGAFSKNTVVEEIHLPKSVTDISLYGLVKCTALKQILVDEENETYSSINGMLCDKNGKTLLYCPIMNAGAECTVPDGIQIIDSMAFILHTSLTAVTLPDSVTAIYGLAFSGCSALTSIHLPDTLQNLSKGAFTKSEGVTETENGITYCGNWALSCAEPTQKITIRKGTVGLADSIFQGNTVTKVYQLPDSLLHIGDLAFAECIAESFTIPASVKTVGQYAFAANTNLKEISVPKDISGFAENAFAGCSNLAIIYRGGDVTDWMPNTEAPPKTNVSNASSGAASSSGLGYRIGDLNEDQAVTIADAVAFQRWLTVGDLTMKHWRTADLDENLSVNAVDFVLLKRTLINQAQEDSLLAEWLILQ